MRHVQFAPILANVPSCVFAFDLGKKGSSGLAKYQESYSVGRLRRWSRQIQRWEKSLAAIYIYFDNDQAGHAARNALTLKLMVNGENNGIANAKFA